MSSLPEREVSVFNAARQLPATERAAYLDVECGEDAPLRQRIEELLRTGVDSGDFLEQPAHAELGGNVVAGGIIPQFVAPVEKTGDRIGPYKLLQQIGEGGCGVVYMAEQETPIRRRVALKVIKLGMDTKQVIARFEGERQALALMDHPNIARVLDAGATDAGRPYFVMELVHGIKVTDYCDQNNLATGQRLELLIQICHAIQHAHQKGIIHRDIKPSNILVTLHDGVPVPKVIDFGIAKATQQRLTDKTLFTALEQFMGTPAYMSPEQAEMSGLDIDTRSDIYSLGVLLYELLTGKTPFEPKDLMVAGLDEMRRVIRETDPVRPSTRLSSLEAAEQTTVARRRQLEAPKLIHLVRGDLDWIVMKALEKDRTRRYESADGFSEDIQRHLNNEPIEARPASSVYRLQKAMRRHKGAFAAAATILVVLVAGVMVSAWQAVRATRATATALAEKHRAEEQYASSTVSLETFERLLVSVVPETAKGSDKLVDDNWAGLEQKLANDPVSLAAVYDTLGKSCMFKGQFTEGKSHLLRAVELRRAFVGARRESYADSLLEYTVVDMFAGGNLDKTEADLREALAIYRQCGVGGQKIIDALYVLQLVQCQRQDWIQVELTMDEALAEAGKSPGIDFPVIASMYHQSITAKIARSQYAEAEKIAREALTLHLKLQGNNDIETGWGYYHLGEALRPQHKLAEALADENRALAIMRKWFPLGHSTIALMGSALAQTQAMVTNELHRAADEEICYQNLQKIHVAIMAFRKDHHKMPDWLGDLVPAYLSDTNCLICPVQARTGEKPDLSGMADTKVASSYLYEFSARSNAFPDPYGVAAPGDTMQMWKEKQLARYGPIVPVIRCRLHAQSLSITFDGERMKSGSGRWEDDAEKKLPRGTRSTPP